MWKIEIYDFEEFKEKYPTLEQSFKKSLDGLVFDFLQCLSMDGDNFEIAYGDEIDEDLTASMEIQLSTLEISNFEISRD